MSRPFRRIAAHSRDCAIADHKEWWFLTGTRLWRDRAGTRRGRTASWLLLSCQDPDCAALVIVREGDVMDAIDGLIEGAP